MLSAYENEYSREKIFEILDGAISSLVNSNIFGTASICHGLAGTLEVLDSIIKRDMDLNNLVELKEKKELLIQRILSIRIKNSDYTYWLGEDHETTQISYMTGVSGIYSILLREKFIDDSIFFI